MKSNIALIGFMGSGKTTLGKEVAKVLHMDFYDTDSYIEKREKMKIKFIFEKKGEEYFRKLEREAIEELSKKDNAIIATGGGVIKSKENMETIVNNALVFYLDCDVDCIYKRVSRKKTRPLLNEAKDVRKKVEELLEERRPIYEKYATYKVPITTKTNLWDSVELIKKLYINFD